MAKFEQRATMKVCFKLGKTATETFTKKIIRSGIWTRIRKTLKKILYLFYIGKITK